MNLYETVKGRVTPQMAAERYADIDVSNERMTINLTDEEGHVLSFNLSQSEVHYVLHMVERRLNSFMRDDGGGGFSDED